MKSTVDIVVLGRAARNAAAIKNRQPIGRMFVKCDYTPDESFVSVIAEELNVKKVIFTDSVREFTTYSFKPQLRTVGPKYGKYLGGIRSTLSTLDGNDAMDQLNTTGKLVFTVQDAEIVLTEEDLLIEMTKKEGFESLSDRGVTVVIDKNLTPELIEEGYVREIISKIQTMRKDSGFEVMDNINIAFAGNEHIESIALKNAELIKDETLGVSLTVGNTLLHSKEWSINGENVTLSVEKL